MRTAGDLVPAWADASSRPDSPRAHRRYARARMLGLLAGGHTEIAFDSVVVHPLVAHTPSQQASGLQNHPSSDVAQGMLFVWEDQAPRPFVIKRVPTHSTWSTLMTWGASSISQHRPGRAAGIHGPHAARYVLEIEAVLGSTARRRGGR